MMETAKSKQMRHGRWSFLPHELLHKIMEKLRYSDCIYAAATCKNWNIPVPTISGSLLWMANHDWFLVTGSNGRSQLYCKLNLYEAMNPKGFQPICRSFDLPGETGRFDIVGKAEVKDSKLGWVLVEIRIVKNHETKKRSKSLLVLYNPFVQDFRFLPALEIPRWVEFAAFSRPPTSSNSNCVVYAISRNRDRRFFRVDSLRWCNDQMTWKVSSCNYDFSIITNANIPRPKFHSVVAMEDGTLYCNLDHNVGSLIAFKNSSDSIQAQTFSFEQALDDDDLDIIDAHLTEHEGELLLVSFCESRSSLRYHRIYRFDKSSNCWILKQGLVHFDDQYRNEFYFLTFEAVIGRIPAAFGIGNGVYVWRMGIVSGGLLFVPLQEEEEEEKVSHVPLKLMFPSYHPGSCGVRVQLLSMGPSSPA